MKIKLILLLLIPIIGVSQSFKVKENTYSSIVVYGDGIQVLKGITSIKYNSPEKGWISTFANNSPQFELKPIEESFETELEFYGEKRKVLIRNFINTKDDLKFQLFIMLDKPERAEVHFFIYDDEGNMEPMLSLMSEEYIDEFYNKNLSK